jgi:hypothetical protein
MSAEAFFYLLFPWMARWKRPERLSPHLAKMAGVWLLGMLPGALYMIFNPDGIPHPDRFSYGKWLQALKYTPLPHMASFVFGVLLAELDEMVDRAVVVARGRTVSVETLNGPQTPSSRARPWRVRALDEALLVQALDRQGIPHGPPEREGVQVELNTEEAAVELLAALVRDEVPVVSFQPSAGVLEQAYLALTEDRR